MKLCRSLKAQTVNKLQGEVQTINKPQGEAQTIIKAQGGAVLVKFSAKW